MKKITITVERLEDSETEKVSLVIDGMNKLEVMGVLRFYEKRLFMEIAQEREKYESEKQNQTP